MPSSDPITPHHPEHVGRDRRLERWVGRWAERWPGLLLAGVLALAAITLGDQPALQRMGLGALTLAIVLGMLLGNSVFPLIAGRAAAGVDFAKGTLLRAGVVLYGLRVTFQQIAGVGVQGLLVDVVMLASVFGLAWWLGTRVFRLDRDTSLLVGMGSAICGAAAVLAAEPVLRAQAHKVSVAVATVVVFGTLAMFVYPVLYPYLGMDAHTYGIYVGSTVHEVAQVVVAGSAVDPQAAATAVIEKMLRVMLLAPFLVLLSAFLRGGGDGSVSGARVQVPWFAVWFVVVAGIHSLQWLPQAWIAVLIQVDTVLLAMAMAALGLRTHYRAIRQAGLAPILLAASLAAYLLVGGWLVNMGVMRLFGAHG